MKFINRFLNLRPGEFVSGLPLFGYYFLIIASYVMGQVARDALFLDKFTATQLPYVDIASAALVGFVVAFYIRLGRHSGLRNLLVVSLLFFASNVAVLWWAAHYYKRPWIYQALYIWVGIFGVLATAQVWTLANFIWTTREAKRLFGLLGSGGIIGAIFGGFFSNWMASTFGTESILLIITLFLVISAGLVVMIWGQRPTGETDAQKTEESPAGLLDSFKLVRKSTHLQAIAGLICLSSIVTTAAGWQLKAIAKETLVQKDVLAAFFGSFQGYTGIGSLVAQLFITTKLLRRFGVGVALLVLPLTLTAGSAAVLIWGTLWAASLLKGGDKVIRYSIDTSALQLLYLPVPANIKLQVKSFIDTVIWRFGDALAGLTLLLFATTLRFTPRQISWLSLGLLAVWIGAALVAKQQYVATLKDNIQQVRVHPDQVSVPILDQFTTNVFAEKLNSQDPNEVLYALTLFEVGQRPRAHSAVRNLLDHPSPHVRKKALSILSGAGDLSVRPQAVALLRDDNLDVRTEALEYLTRHDGIDPIANIEQLGDFTDSSICSATVAFLAKPGEAQNLDAAGMILDGMVREDGENGGRTRIEAAHLIASLPDHFDSQLELLMKDADPEVLRQAMRSAALLRKRRFVPAIIDHLGNEKLAADATEALAHFEDAIIGTLRDHLNDPKEPLEIRQRIPQVLLRIGTASAAGVLGENLLQGDTVLRFRIIAALNKLYEVRRNLTLDRPLVETIMIAELMGHYRSYQIMGITSGVLDESLKQSMNDELERIFRLMKLLFPSLDLQNAYLGVQSEDPVTHSNALEFLDNTLTPQLRTMLVPLIDSEVTVQERIRLADRFLGFSIKT
jgi:AAA family ATP:ADP antiporter